MNTFQSDLTALFVQNFSESIVCLFQDGYHNGVTDFGRKFISMDTFTPTTPNEQPTSGYWMRIKVDNGAVTNDSISDGDTKEKRMLVFVQADIIWHEDESSKLLYETIEPALDAIFLNTKIRGVDNSEIYNQQDVPKDQNTTYPTGDSVWTTKSIVYPFVVKYF